MAEISSIDKALAADQFISAKKYWLNKLAGELEKSSIYYDFIQNEGEVEANGRVDFVFDQDIAAKLQKISAGSDYKLQILLTAGVVALLARHTGSHDIMLGTSIYQQAVAGKFINTILPLRNQFTAETSFKDLILTVRQGMEEAVENQNYPMERLVEDLGLDYSTTDFPLFDVAVLLENIQDKQYLAPLRPKIIFSFVRHDTQITGALEYNPGFYHQETVAQIGRQLNTLFQKVLTNLNQPVDTVEMLTNDEREQLLDHFNDTRLDFPQDKTIQELFEEQVRQNPEQIAVEYENQRLTYGELNQKANHLAVVLREKGLKTDSIAGIMAHHSLEMFIGILGILKAGGAFLPIDPGYPESRIEYMLSDSAAQLLLTQKCLAGKVKFEGELLALDDPQYQRGSDSNPSHVNQATDLAYVIYTSGSTGQPKGVMIEHRSVINLATWQKRYFQITPSDRTTKYSGFGFDGSVWEIILYLIHGASIYVVNEDIKLDIRQLIEFFNRRQITISYLPTPICEQFMDVEIPSLTRLQTGGDKLRNYVKKSYQLTNNYGPTETTVIVTSFVVDRNYENIPIGKPLGNTRIYILNRNGQLQPTGVPGELCISGAGLARGYLNRPELTGEKFVVGAAPPQEGIRETPQRIYKTGDLARWLPDGNIEFLGRVDQQVKIRGCRIEISEIEAQLLKHEFIKEAVVIVRKDRSKNQYLCAFLVSGHELKLSEVRNFLAQKLPDYMIPSYFIQLGKLPLTPNGKVDQKALADASKYPEPEGLLNTEVEYTPPQNATEAGLAGIWQELLGVERVGINDNFFELGGHSLKATVLVARVYKEFNVELPLREVFKTPTVKELAQCIERSGKSQFLAIQPAPERECYPASSAQKRMYILNRFEGAGTIYNLSGALIIKGNLDQEKLERTFQTLMKRHDSFRTSFSFVDGAPVQQIWPEDEGRIMAFRVEYWEIADDGGHAGNGRDRSVLHAIIRNFIRAFDLSQAPLFRAGLFKLGGQEHLLIFDMHHIIADGTSMAVLEREFIDLYEGKELPALRLQYKDFAIWQNDFLQSDALKKQATYWREQFAGEIPVLNLPLDYTRPAVQSFEGRHYSFYLEAEVTRELQKITAQTGTTLFMVLLAAYYILLSKYSGQDEIVIGTPIAGRRHPDLEKIIGMFVNTLALRNRIPEEKPFGVFLADLKEDTLRAYENQEYQFEQLIEELDIQRDLSRNPLFDVMFVMQNLDLRAMETGDLRFETYPWENQITKFDLTLQAMENGDQIDFTFEYSSKLFSAATITKLAEHLQNLVASVSANPEIIIAEIELMAPDEKERILYKFNDTGMDYHRNKTIPELFEERVKQQPDRIAVVFGEQSLTYSELNRRANQLATVLREKGVKPDSVAGIMVYHSLEMFIGILAVLKAGGAYLPIDPELPDTRIQFMLNDSNAGWLLVPNSLAQKVEFAGEWIILDDSRSYQGAEFNREPAGRADDIAYVIYTSGSTGTPKGVMIEHHSVINLAEWQRTYFQVTPQDRTIKYSGFGFDGSVWEIILYLINGASIYVIPEEIKLDLPRLAEFFRTHQITIAYLPTQICEQFMEMEIPTLTRMQTGGDKLRNFKKRDYLFTNNYGPTETTIIVTNFVVDQNYERFPIGKPLGNTELYILEKNGRLQPMGVPGELCISGVGLARGYLNRPELTAEKFVNHPFRPGVRMYKSGDLTRWLPDGNIEFLGRIDQQVKIRGCRIEIGEIEAQLLNYPAISQAVVLIGENGDGDNYLCAYIVAEAAVNVSQVREFLFHKLPGFMVPAFIIPMQQLPLAPSGKVDRKALPAPERNVTSNVDYVAPKTDLEKMIADIWKDVLKQDQIGLHDNFFEMGGNSIKIIQLASQLNEKVKNEFTEEISVITVFQYPTIGSLISHVTEEQEKRIHSEEKTQESLSKAKNVLTKTLARKKAGLDHE